MTHGTIVAPQPEAVEVGALALKQGGNSVDAAVACAFAQGVVDPQMAGIAGFGTMQVYLPDRGIHECIDFHARAPSATTETQWADLIEGETRDGFGFILKGWVNDLGYQSVAVPGSLRGYWDAHARYGLLPWKDIVAPSIALARDGFAIRPHMHTYWRANEQKLGRVNMIDKLRFSEEGRALYFDAEGRLKEPGSILRNPSMASCLTTIAEDGGDSFYSGGIAETIATDFARHGGKLCLQDLRDYRTRRSEPVWGSYRGFELSSSPPPGGGIVLIELLNILENFDLKSLGHNSPEYLHILAEAMKLATIDKDLFAGDPAHSDVPVDRFCSKGHAAGLADRIRKGPLVQVERLGSPLESVDTTHTSVIDEHGGVVAMTHSLGYPSGVITSGLGFMYNGCMNIFDPRPGRQSSLAPGKSRLTAMAPTLLFKDGEPILVTGAPGGTAITMAIAQSIVNFLDFGMTMFEAVSAPRISATSNVVDVVNRIPRYVTDELERMGHKIARSQQSYTLGAVHAIERRNGKWIGAADPARDGMALEV